MTFCHKIEEIIVGDSNMLDLNKELGPLGLDHVELSQLLDVDIRTVKRWASNQSELPGPVKTTLMAWQRLNELGLPWRPDASDALNLHPDQLAKLRVHNFELSEALRRAEERGGPKLPWEVDLGRGRARLNGVFVSFYRLPNGSFSPQSYWLDSDNNDYDPKNIQEILDDAFDSIAKAISAHLKLKSKTVTQSSAHSDETKAA